MYQKILKSQKIKYKYILDDNNYITNLIFNIYPNYFSFLLNKYFLSINK